MKTFKLSLLIGILLFMGCQFSVKRERSIIGALNDAMKIDSTNIVNKDSLNLNGNTGVWTYKNQIFTGFAVKYHSNEVLKEKTGFFNGKKQDVYQVWHDNGVLKLKSHYNQNVLVDTYKTWWDNGVLASESHYEGGKKQGIESQWYSNGVLAKKRNLLDDKEDGLQQAWLENGRLYVNYEAKNGRIFGMRRANSCYQLKNEVVIRNNKIVQ